MRALSLLPLPVLYAVCAIAAWILQLIGWRRDLVIGALGRCLPELEPSARMSILRNFYCYLGELAAEVLHAGRISQADLDLRMRIDNPDVVIQALRDGRRVVLLAAHHGNWEWLLQRCSTAFDVPLVAAYKPASWKRADQSLRFMRSRFGAEMVPAKALVSTLLVRRCSTRLLALLADQSPSARSTQQVWLRYFGQDTAFFPGPGLIAGKLGYLPIFVAVRRESRGRYTARLLPLVAAGERAEPATVLSAYVVALEAQVRESPAQYFWAYNRWKRPRPPYD